MPREYFNQILTPRNQTIINKFPSYREDYYPTEDSSIDCTLCRSGEDSSSTDSCSGINTRRNGFYVMVYGQTTYNGAELFFTGNNLLNLERINNYNFGKFSLNKPFISNNILD